MSGLRALHLFSNFKWTGPADPAIRCARGLRRLGVDVMFAQASCMRGEEHRMAIELRRERLPVTADMKLGKHYGPVAAWRDSGVLTARVRRGDFDLLHANLLSDHISASLAKRRVSGRAGGRELMLVRTIHDPEAPSRNLRSRFAFGNTDGVVVPTPRCAVQVAHRFRLPPERVHVQEPTTDTRRFARIDRSLRDEWGLTEDHFLIGITARVQPHRRFGFLWDVARRVVDAHAGARFVLFGRGHEDDMRTLVHEPIERLGLGPHVLEPRYLVEPEYSLAIAALDLFTFLVPGSDGTCRAVREALAAGVPVVTTKRGILPELVVRRPADELPAGVPPAAGEPCGLAIEEDVELFAAAIGKLIDNPEARANLQTAARARVATLMDEDLAARRLLAFYRRLRGEEE